MNKPADKSIPVFSLYFSKYFIALIFSASLSLILYACEIDFTLVYINYSDDQPTDYRTSSWAATSASLNVQARKYSTPTQFLCDFRERGKERM